LQDGKFYSEFYAEKSPAKHIARIPRRARKFTAWNIARRIFAKQPARFKSPRKIPSQESSHRR
jgi:hypothetical protein